MTALVELRLPAAPESLAIARARLAEFLARLPLGPDAVFELEVALSEACTNVIQYSGMSQMTVRFLLVNGEVTVEIADRGAGFDPAILKRPYAVGDVSGRGFLLMRALTDRLDVKTTPAGTTVRLVKRVLVGGSVRQGIR